MTASKYTATNSNGYESPVGITADPVIFTIDENDELSVLLAKRTEAPFEGAWALPGGFVGASEDPAATTLRKLEEKTGISDEQVYLEQLRTYATPGRDPRGWLPSIAYLALVPATVLGEGGSQESEWHPIDKLPKLAFDHGTIIIDGIERLRGKLRYSNVAVGLLPEEFTMLEARRVYEMISGEHYNASNFARDLIATELIAETGNRVSRGPGPAARTYRFLSRQPSWGPTYGKPTKKRGQKK